MRGEDAQLKADEGKLQGSPPHARGRPTPLPTRRRSTRDHPRMRGEDATMRHCSMILSGSPPHARGRLISVVLGTERTRITPACAGKTTLSLAAALQPKDHPRMRGEDVLDRPRHRRTRPSPPHARGRRMRQIDAQMDVGITPACAGKTISETEPTARRSDHPRMRGEDPFIGAWFYGDGGSPPHARGRPSSLLPTPTANRITPACAGKTA